MKSSITKQSPGTQRGVDRCTLLFDVATELFLKYGYDHVSLDQIVEHAGGSKATIYKYFGSKKGLFIAICQERCNLFIHKIELAYQQKEVDIQQKLSNLLFDLFEIMQDNESIAFKRLVNDMSKENADLAQQLYDLGPKRAYALLADFLQEAHDLGEIYCTQPQLSAIYFFGFFHDIQWRTMVGLPAYDPSIDIKQYIQYTVDRFIAGHQKPEKIK